MSLILMVVLASLLGSFLCSLCEASLYAVTPTQFEILPTDDWTPARSR